MGPKFLFLFFLNSIFFILSKKNHIKIFYYLFIASTISPIFFFTFLNKGVDYYHFFNWIVVFGLLFPLIFVFYFLESKFQKYLNIYQYKSLLFFLTFVMFFYSSLNNILSFKDKAAYEYTKRLQLNETINFIYGNKLFNKKNLEILNFNFELSVWLLLNDYKNFSLIPVSFWTPKTDHKLEEELISSIKFLGFNKNNFYNLIKNKKNSWRIKNDFVYSYFGRKYMANSLIVFNNDKSDYDQTEKIFIESNSLIISHQVIIPKSEIKRLLNKFDTHNKKINPDIVILDNSDDFKMSKFKNTNYCLIFNNDKFMIYSNKKLNYKCLLTKN